MIENHQQTEDNLKMTLALSQVAAALGVDLVGEDRMFVRVSINTKTIESGDLFVAIKGDNFDAHEFIDEAEKKGACGAVVECCSTSALPQIRVENTRRALGDIASLWSSAFALPIIAITGSCGKTTVKEMTAAIMGHGYKKKNQEGYEHILATQGNLNNDIGVPLTLLRLNKEHQAAVIELGANHIGEIKQLVDMVQPDVAVITNASHAHIEGFGSLEGVAKAKAEIYSGLESNGTAIINADDQFADFWRNYCQKLNESYEQTKPGTTELHEKINIVTFGLNKVADVSAEYKVLANGNELTLRTPIGEQVLILKAFGKHNIYNALAAASAAIYSGCSLADVKRGLESFTNVSGRLEQKQGLQGAVMYDDTYNANPGSVKAGIEAIQQFALQHNKTESIAVLGDMAELGEESKQLHYQLGVDVADMNIRQLFTVGQNCVETCRGFNSCVGDKNESVNSAEHFKNKEELIQKLKDVLHGDCVVLIKGSRSMGMESVVDALLADQPPNKNVTEGIQ